MVTGEQRRIGKKLNQYIDQEQWVAAEKLARGLVKELPDDHWVVMRLADAIYEQRRYRTALRLYRKAMALAPHCQSVRWSMAGALAACDETREAKRIYQSIARMRPEVLAARECSEGLRWARGLIADSHYRLGQLAEWAGAKAVARRHYQAYLRCTERSSLSIETRKGARAKLRALSI